jgi:uncharacterized protein YdaT
MRNLAPEARTKAIAIANLRLNEGYDEGKAIRIAICQGRGVGRAPTAVVALKQLCSKNSLAANAKSTRGCSRYMLTGT